MRDLGDAGYIYIVNSAHRRILQPPEKECSLGDDESIAVFGLSTNRVSFRLHKFLISPNAPLHLPAAHRLNEWPPLMQGKVVSRCKKSRALVQGGRLPERPKKRHAQPTKRQLLIISIAKRLAAATEESERDHLIEMLTGALHGASTAMLEVEHSVGDASLVCLTTGVPEPSVELPTTGDVVSSSRDVASVLDALGSPAPGSATRAAFVGI